MNTNINYVKISEGSPYPLGATWDGSGVNFALYSKNAEYIYLCLFDNDYKESLCIPVRNRTHYIWHCYIEGIRPGQLYGYRVGGPYDPEKGHRFNPSKVLLDPYVLAIGRDLIWSTKHFAYDFPYNFNKINLVDNSKEALLGAVIDPAFSWGNDKLLKIPWKDTIIYEVHLKGFTKLNHFIPEQLRGTYLGFTVDEVIKYLKDLGVTTIEFLPIQHSITEYHLYKNNKTNYWGYNPIALFAPNPNYAYDKSIMGAINEFKTMIKVLHQAGFEVILDVVFNHTAEGDHTGPTLSFRGIDNLSYYRVYEERKDLYLDFTGCGNTLNHQNHQVLQLVMDSLRYWITEMHVDGFRFDLASVLARELYEVDRLTSFFAVIQQDPIISQVKLIAEPWDLGRDGYQVGNFPPGWSEWNGKYRDTIRKVINEYEKNLSDFATRISGSSDLYKKDDRKTYSSINFVTCHDGFTLRDLVSYNTKHNEENGWNNMDGTDENYSRNYGVEGDTSNQSIRLLRLKKQKLFLTTLFISQGVPMLLAGDELNRTQLGNNNAYCLDNETNYIHWELDEYSWELLTITKYLIHLRKTNEVFRRKEFFEGEEKTTMEVKDVYWIHSEGREMKEEDWQNELCLGMIIPSEFGERFDFYTTLEGDTFFIIFNFSHEEKKFKIPDVILAKWKMIFSTEKCLFISDEAKDTGFSFESNELLLKKYSVQDTFLERNNMQFYESLEILMSDGKIYVPNDIINVPSFTILILKANKNWREEHVRKNLRIKLIEELSVNLGIQKKYVDLMGREYELSYKELLALLRAQHIPIKDFSSIETVYENFINDTWFLNTQPIYIFTKNTQYDIEIIIPETMKLLSLQILNDSSQIVYEDKIYNFNILESHCINFSRFKKLKLIKIGVKIQCDLHLGYYDLLIYHDNILYSKGTLVIVPNESYTNQKIYTGIWIQLYALKSQTNLGIGDWGDLKKFALKMKQYGYNLIGLSPLHYLPIQIPQQISPYYPASRLVLNPMYIDIFSLEEFHSSQKAIKYWKENIEKIEKEKNKKIMDYELIYKIKKEILYQMFLEFSSNPKYSNRYNEFLKYKENQEMILYHALFEAIIEVYGKIEPPREIYKYHSHIQQEFIKEHSNKIDFYSYLFYTVEKQFISLLEDLKKQDIYVYLDLALGSAPDQAEAIYFKNFFPYLFSQNARAGAPPDPFSPKGQDWGITVMNPLILKKYEYKPFIQLLRRNLFQDTLLRIDHVMWMYRLFWIVKEGNDITSTYIRYPEKELFGILSLESHRTKNIIIGEDLGTVPDEVRKIMKEKNILSWKVLYFEKENNHFKDPRTYPHNCVVTINTHDLPTLAGYWMAKDIEEKQKMGLINEEEAKKQYEIRNEERKQFVKLLQQKGYFKDREPITEDSVYGTEIASYFYQLIGESPSKILLVSLNDLLGESDQPNMPGTIDEYPNWRIRYSVPIEEIDENPFFVAITKALSNRLKS